MFFANVIDYSTAGLSVFDVEIHVLILASVFPPVCCYALMTVGEFIQTTHIFSREYTGCDGDDILSYTVT